MKCTGKSFELGLVTINESGSVTGIEGWQKTDGQKDHFVVDWENRELYINGAAVVYPKNVNK